ncbi:MAG: sugar phosphate nucleotidyltransferase [Actinomycetota bacterium]
MQVVILAGGRGTRAMPFTTDQPKPMLRLAGTPLVEHVMRIYAEQGFDRFVLAIGHRGEVIEDHVRDRALPWEVRFSRAGDDADTGTRLGVAAEQCEGAFLATYGDGFGDVDLAALVQAHRASGRAASLTAVRLRSQYGTVDIDPGGLVHGFREKPTFDDVWINGGFFVFETRALEGSAGTSLERDVLPALATRGELHAYRHHGFWRSVDTFKDLEELEAMITEGTATWAGLTVGESS